MQQVIMRHVVERFVSIFERQQGIATSLRSITYPLAYCLMVMLALSLYVILAPVVWVVAMITAMWSWTDCGRL